MKSFKLYWQRIHYMVFLYQRFTQIHIYGKPILLLLKNKWIKKQYQKRGIANPEKLVKKTLTSKKNSTILWISDVFMCVLWVMIIFTVFNFLSAIVGKVLLASINKVLFVMIGLIPSIFLNYFLLWKDDEYLDAFEAFEKDSKEIRRKWIWVSLISILGIMSLMIASFWIMTESLRFCFIE